MARAFRQKFVSPRRRRRRENNRLAARRAARARAIDTLSSSRNSDSSRARLITLAGPHSYSRGESLDRSARSQFRRCLARVNKPAAARTVKPRPTQKRRESSRESPRECRVCTRVST
jgi:hypothetical protein